MPEHIIYSNDDHSTVLLDIPQSIQDAQCFDCGNLLSCEPLSLPWSTPEPASKDGQGNISNFASERDLHCTYADACAAALTSITPFYSARRSFCNPRKFISDAGLKRKRSSIKDLRQQPDAKSQRSHQVSSESNRVVSNHEVGHFSADDPSTALRSLSISGCWLPSSWPAASADGEDCPDSSHANHEASVTHGCHLDLSEWASNVHLCSEHANPAESTYSFHVPPHCAFVLGSCEGTGTFQKVSRQFVTQGRFGFVLLDPPWPNKSADRKRSYNTTMTVTSLRDLILDMDLDMHLNNEGVLAFWITNRASVRQAVMHMFIHLR